MFLPDFFARHLRKKMFRPRLRDPQSPGGAGQGTRGSMVVEMMEEGFNETNKGHYHLWIFLFDSNESKTIQNNWSFQTHMSLIVDLPSKELIYPT